jgi:hypothetical protein
MNRSAFAPTNAATHVDREMELIFIILRQRLFGAAFRAPAGGGAKVVAAFDASAGRRSPPASQQPYRWTNARDNGYNPGWHYDAMAGFEYRIVCRNIETKLTRSTHSPSIRDRVILDGRNADVMRFQITCALTPNYIDCATFGHNVKLGIGMTYGEVRVQRHMSPITRNPQADYDSK